MPSLKAIFTGDANPLVSELKKISDEAAKSSAKVVRALEAESLELKRGMHNVERGTQAWIDYAHALMRVQTQMEAVQAESTKIQQSADLSRYLASPSQAGSAGLRFERENAASTDAELLKKRAQRTAIARFNAEMRAAAAETARYLASPSQASIPRNDRAMNALDDADWQKKFAAAKAAKGIAVGAGAQAGAGFMSGFFKKITGNNAGYAQLIHVVRATFDSLVSGMSPTRVLLQQGPQAAQALAIMGKDFLKLAAAIAVPAAAIGAMIGAVFIFRHRVNSLVKDMVGLTRETFNVDHIAKYLQKANILTELQKDVTAEVRRTVEAHDSVVESLNRELDLTKDRIAFERELLEIQKANELASARTPAQREAIEKKYSSLILAKKKEERDAELQALRDQAAQLPKEIQKAQNEIKRMTGAGFYTEAADSKVLEDRKKASAVYDAYREQLKPGEKDTREFSADKDRATIDKLTRLQGQKFMDPNMPGVVRTYQLSDKEQQTLANARERLAKSNATMQVVNQWLDSGGERLRARERVAELEKKIKEDAAKLAALGNDNRGGIHDLLVKNQQRDKEELKLEQERLKRSENAGSRSGSSSFTTSSFEHAGGFMAGPLLTQNDLLKQIVAETKKVVINTSPGRGRPTYAPARGPGFGGMKR